MGLAEIFGPLWNRPGKWLQQLYESNAQIEPN